MTVTRNSPAAIARRIAARRNLADEAQAGARESHGPVSGGKNGDGRPERQGTASSDAPVSLSPWRRECFLLPAGEARETARAWLDRYPRSRWRSEIESWQVVGDDLVQFTMRRLPDADQDSRS